MRLQLLEGGTGDPSIRVTKMPALGMYPSQATNPQEFSVRRLARRLDVGGLDASPQEHSVRRRPAVEMYEEA